MQVVISGGIVMPKAKKVTGFKLTERVML